MRVSKKDFIGREMKENPEFFKAFPHLQEPVFDHANPGAPNQMYMNEVKNSELFSKHDLKADSSKHDGYFDTLLHQHTRYMEELTPEEMIRENEIQFVQGYQSPMGPTKYMSAEAKQRVHQEIDRRMQELEDTGLTRWEILFEK